MFSVKRLRTDFTPFYFRCACPSRRLPASERRPGDAGELGALEVVSQRRKRDDLRRTWEVGRLSLRHQP